MSDSFETALKTLLALTKPDGSPALLFNEPLNTSFKTGGNAFAVLYTIDAAQIITALELCKTHAIPCFVMGAGTNILVADSGYNGLVIKPCGGFGLTAGNDGQITASADVMLAKAAQFALAHSLSGMEALAGIPGTIGGAAYMNAGAYGVEFYDCLAWADVILNNEVKRLNGTQLKPEYRKTALTENGGIVLSVCLALKKGVYEEIKQKTDEYAIKRRASQPLNYPSAGSAFKRPQNGYAARLIEESMLKGYTIGGAQVSEKHAGFIINTGNASSSDIYKLIMHVKEVVHTKTGVMLEPEIKFIGEF